MNSHERRLLFSITRDQFRLEFFRAGGKGGQKQNKTSSACRITHLASGAVGEARDERSQSQNRKAALKRLADSVVFKAWLKIEIARRRMNEHEIEQRVDRMLDLTNLRIETRDNDRWVETAL